MQGEERCSSSLNYMDVSDKLHASAALTPVKNPVPVKWEAWWAP